MMAGSKTQAKANFLAPGEHVIIAKDGDDTVDGSGQIREVEAGVGAGLGGLIEDHGVLLPLQSIFQCRVL